MSWMFICWWWMLWVASKLNWKLPTCGVKTSLKGTAWFDGNHWFMKSHTHFLLQNTWCTCCLLLNFFWKGKKKKSSAHNVKRVRRRGNHQNIIWSLQESHSPLTGRNPKCKRESEILEKVSSGWEAYNKASWPKRESSAV